MSDFKLNAKSIKTDAPLEGIASERIVPGDYVTCVVGFSYKKSRIGDVPEGVSISFAESGQQFKFTTAMEGLKVVTIDCFCPFKEES